jgi:hypothetical protein
MSPMHLHLHQGLKGIINQLLSDPPTQHKAKGKGKELIKPRDESRGESEPGEGPGGSGPDYDKILEVSAPFMAPDALERFQLTP